MRQTTREKQAIPPAHLVCVIALAVQLVYGGLMTLFFVKGWTYVVLTGLTLLLLVMWWLGRDTRGVRVTARVLTGLAYAVAGIPLLELVMSALSNWYISPEQCVLDMCCMGLPVLLWLAPAMGVFALSRGRYDRFVACFTQGWLLVLSVLAATVDGVKEQIPWTWQNNAFAVILVGLTLFATVTVWLCALRRPREEIRFEGTTLSLEEE